MKFSINQGINTSVVACVHRLGDICIIKHQVASSNPCAFHACDVGQCHAASTKASTHQPWRVCTDRIHRCWTMANSIIQGHYASGERLNQMESIITNATLVMVYCIGLFLCISFSGRQIWTARIIHSLYTLLNGQWVWLSCITLMLHETSSWCCT